MGIWQWSTTPGSNDGADSSINFREGQAPSTLNNSTRAVMAALKAWWLDLGGMIDTGGTSTAYTLTTNQSITTLTDGARVSARLHATNGANATLAVDGTTAKAITISPDVPPSAGMLVLGTVQTFVYDAGDDEWRVTNVIVPDGIAKTGDKKDKFTSTVDPGWLAADGRTIGNAASGGTSRANADTSLLFAALWGEYSNTILPIQDSSGSASSRGADAATDYAANKRLPLPNVSGRVFAALDNLSGSSANVVTNSAADTLGGTMGEENHTLLKAEIPSYTLDLSSLTVTLNNLDNAQRNASTFVVTPGSGNTIGNLNSGTPTATVGGSIPSGGSGTPMNNMQPTFFGYVFIKL